MCAKIQCFQNVQCMPFELFVVFVDEFGIIVRRILFRLSAVQLYKQPTPVNLHADAIAMHHLICTKRDISMKSIFVLIHNICTGWRLMARAHLCTVFVRALWRCSLLFVPHGFDVSPRPEISPREMGWIYAASSSSIADNDIFLFRSYSVGISLSLNGGRIWDALSSQHSPPKRRVRCKYCTIQSVTF